MRGERFPRGVLQCQMHPTFHSCLLKIWPRFTGRCQNTSATLTREWNTAATWASSVLLGEQKRKGYLSSSRSNLRNTYCCLPSWDLKYTSLPCLCCQQCCLLGDAPGCSGSWLRQELPLLLLTRGALAPAPRSQGARSHMPVNKCGGMPPKKNQMQSADGWIYLFVSRKSMVFSFLYVSSLMKVCCSNWSEKTSCMLYMENFLE